MHNKNTRIVLDDTGMDATMKLAEGNPGAVTAVCEMAMKVSGIDPDDAFGPFGPILALDSLGIYGPRIWMFYKDVCGQDVTKCLALLRGVQLGFLDDAKLDHVIDHRGEGIDIDDILKKVKIRLPRFASEGKLPHPCSCGHSHGAPHNCPGCDTCHCSSATEGSPDHGVTEVTVDCGKKGE